MYRPVPSTSKDAASVPPTLRLFVPSPSSMTRTYFDPKALDTVLAEHVAGRQNHEKLLWALLNLEIWHRQYAP